MFNTNLPSTGIPIVMPRLGESTTGTGFESTNAQVDPFDSLDQDNLNFLELAGFDTGSGSSDSGSSSGNSIVDSFDDDNQAFLDLAGLSGGDNPTPGIGNQNASSFPSDQVSDFTFNRVSDNSANTESLDSDKSKLGDNQYDFSELLDLYNQSLAKQYEFNAQEAQKDRDWQEYMSSTAYQRAFEDMKKAGLNPLVALGQLGPASTPGGASASGSYGSISPLASSLVSWIMSNKNLINGISSSVVRSIATFLAAIFG